MFESVFDGFDVAEHHGGGGGEAVFMGDFHDFEPLVAGGFEGGDTFTDAVDEDFAASAGDGAEAGLGELADDIVERELEDFAEVDELTGAEAVDIDCGEFVTEVIEEVEVPIDGEVGVVSALEEDLGSSLGEGFLDFLVEFIEGDDVGVGVPGDAVEGAELAVDVADIGVIDIAVDDVADDVVAAVIEGGSFGEVTPVVG